MRNITGLSRVFFAFLFFVLIVSCAAAPTASNGSGSGPGGITYPAGVYVATNGSDTNTGLTKSDPLQTIQLAISTAMYSSLSNVYVQEGYYITNAGLSTITINPFASGMTVYGGCDSSFTPQTGHYSILDAQRTKTNIMNIADVTNFTMNGFVITGSSNRTSVYLLETAMFVTNAFGCVITNCVFTGNSGYAGGALSMTDCDSNVVSAVFVSNACSYGGALLLKGGKNNLFCSAFSNNTASQSGAGLALLGNSSSNLITGIFANNTSGTGLGGSGGGIIINSTMATNNIVSGCLVINNKAIEAAGSGLGGGMYITGPYSKVINCVVSNNFASSSGGGIFITSSPFMSVSNCTISSNQVTNTLVGSGAGIHIQTSDNSSIISTLIINHLCTNTRSGGGLYAYANSFSLIDSTVSNNASYYFGGGCYFGPGNGYLVSNSTISGNLVTNSGVTGMGGGIYITGSNSTIFGCMIKNNSTSEDDDQGGGMYINGSNTFVKWCVISNNIGAYGGGVYCVKYTELNENYIESNYAQVNGAGVYFTNGIYLLYNRISQNYCLHAGGGAGLYAENAWGKIYVNMITSNLGGSWGNGIYIKNSSLTNDQNYFINDGINITLVGNTTPGGLIFSVNTISGTSIYNTGTAIYEILSDTTNHEFYGNTFVTNRIGSWLYDDFSTNDVKNDASWTNINRTNYIGATTVYANTVTTW